MAAVRLIPKIISLIVACLPVAGSVLGGVRFIKYYPFFHPDIPELAKDFGIINFANLDLKSR